MDEIKNFFSDSELNKIYEIQKRHIVHPLKELLLYKEDSICNNNHYNNVMRNTQNAFKYLLRENPQWLVKEKKRFIKSDFKDSSSLLSEIRAYKNLHIVNPKTFTQDSGSDFYLEYKNGDKKTLRINVEVICIDINEEERIKWENFNKNQSEIIDIISIIPFGLPKSNLDLKSSINEIAPTISENAIYKIRSKKMDKDEKQLACKKLSILCVDLQANPIRNIINEDWAKPIFLYHNKFVQSGILWYAFYGKKGDKLYEDEMYYKTQREMQINGRFNKKTKTKLDMVIFSLPTKTIAFENPYAKQKFPLLFYFDLLQLYGFDYHLSMLRYPANTLLKYIHCERKKCNQLYMKIEKALTDEKEYYKNLFSDYFKRILKFFK